MKKIKVICVFGTRPEAIKMAPLVLEMRRQTNLFECIVCVTAQHRQMLNQVLEIFDIKPEYDLDIMEPQQTLSTITSKALLGLEKVFQKENPDLILVHGDTTTTLSGALAAFYNKTPVGHVEAGLRTYDNYSPFPEEMNRKLVGAMATLHFAPTMRNVNNLMREDIKNNVYLTGNTVVDALKRTVKKDFISENKTLATLEKTKRIILVTAHRRENYGEPMEHMMRALRRIADAQEDIEIVYPVHLSPYIQKTAERFLSKHPRIHLMAPLSVNEMHNLMDRSYLVLTDSGGIQEEAPSLGKPVLVLRKETERPEAVDAGTVELVGVDEEDIVASTLRLINDAEAYEKMAQAVNPYGDGYASERIVQAIASYFGQAEEPLPFLQGVK